MDTGMKPGFDSRRGVSIYPTPGRPQGRKAHQDEQRRIEQAREDEFLTSGERFERIKKRGRHA